MKYLVVIQDIRKIKPVILQRVQGRTPYKGDTEAEVSDQGVTM